MNIGRAIRFCRQQKGLTQPQLAERAALSASYLSVLETGKGKRDPSLSSLQSIARGLGVPLSVLLFVAADPSDVETLTPEMHEKLAAATMKLLTASRDDRQAALV
ncbi:MAG: helix-turn-helix domain-containing protein [Burkholderiales bacterium]|jgi:transcriptional regulator with XRE-family HTH domain|nr:helix-turn-helix domain-containing protein [Burkholderiales bacterium]